MHDMRLGIGIFPVVSDYESDEQFSVEVADDVNREPEHYRPEQTAKAGQDTLDEFENPKPGSPTKVYWMEKRQAAGLCLWFGMPLTNGSQTPHAEFDSDQRGKNVTKSLKKYHRKKKAAKKKAKRDGCQTKTTVASVRQQVLAESRRPDSVIEEGSSVQTGRDGGSAGANRSHPAIIESTVSEIDLESTEQAEA